MIKNNSIPMFLVLLHCDDAVETKIVCLGHSMRSWLIFDPTRKPTNAWHVFWLKEFVNCRFKINKCFNIDFNL